MPNLKMNCWDCALRIHNATPRENVNIRTGMLTTSIVNEGIDSIWWG